MPTSDGLDPFIAWCAGLYEGEGTVYYNKAVKTQKGRTYIQHQLMIQIGMTDLDVLEKFQEFVDCGTISGPYYDRGRNRPIWRYYICKFNDVKRVMEDLTPWLSKRRIAQWEKAYNAYCEAKR